MKIYRKMTILCYIIILQTFMLFSSAL
jgi:hypothetical protein